MPTRCWGPPNRRWGYGTRSGRCRCCLRCPEGVNAARLVDGQRGGRHQEQEGGGGIQIRSRQHGHRPIELHAIRHHSRQRAGGQRQRRPGRRAEPVATIGSRIADAGACNHLPGRLPSGDPRSAWLPRNWWSVCGTPGWRRPRFRSALTPPDVRPRGMGRNGRLMLSLVARPSGRAARLPRSSARRRSRCRPGRRGCW